MVATPRFKVFNSTGTYVAACKYAEDAAMVAASHGEGATVRDGYIRVVWVASDDVTSYDDAAATIVAATR